jgi:hypothetical protein
VSNTSQPTAPILLRAALALIRRQLDEQFDRLHDLVEAAESLHLGEPYEALAGVVRALNPLPYRISSAMQDIPPELTVHLACEPEGQKP